MISYKLTIMKRKQSNSIMTTLVLAFILFSLPSWAQYTIESRTGVCDFRAHDPVMIKHGNTFYLFCTGPTVSTSSDMVNWINQGRVFVVPPEWPKESLPNYRGGMWAPDISYHNGKYYLFYSSSAFYRNTSVIGVATNKTLDPEDPDYLWVDHGKVVESVPGRDMFNAIDPNLVVDDDGTGWLVFGSFWMGIKLVRMNEDMTRPAEPQEWYTVAARPRDLNNTGERLPGEGAIEAPFIFKKNGMYYLFVSFDYCCRGVQSTYKIMVGRSENVTGPYLDKYGMDMITGAATPVLVGNHDWPGVGHNSAYTIDGKDYLVFHAYDAADNGTSKLVIREIRWDEDGWPIVGDEVDETTEED